jgi:hypothetical protein
VIGGRQDEKFALIDSPALFPPQVTGTGRGRRGAGPDVSA